MEVALLRFQVCVLGVLVLDRKMYLTTAECRSIGCLLSCRIIGYGTLHTCGFQQLMTLTFHFDLEMMS